jgi:hypothetical protein
VVAERENREQQQGEANDDGGADFASSFVRGGKKEAKTVVCR